MMADHFIDDEAKEFLGKIGIQIGILGQLTQPFNLPLFAPRIGRRQGRLRLMLAHGLRDLEPLGEHEDEGGIDIVDALAVLVQDFVRHRAIHADRLSAGQALFTLLHLRRRLGLGRAACK
jgi:octaprenyl-diphosphate synthase